MDACGASVFSFTATAVATGRRSGPSRYRSSTSRADFEREQHGMN